MILNLAGNKAINLLMREGVGHTAVSAPKVRIEGPGIDAIKFKVPT